MFCDYCRVLFEFRQPLLPYTPPLKKILGSKQQVDATASPNHASLAIEAAAASTQESTPGIRIHQSKDVDSLMTGRSESVWWKSDVGPEGLRTGVTHSPGLNCQICDMVFSNISPSLVEAVFNSPRRDKDPMKFVYQLSRKRHQMLKRPKKEVAQPDAVLSVWLDVNGNLLPMTQLQFSTAESITSLSASTHEPSTGSRKVLDQAASWLRSCDKRHKCSHIEPSEYRLPTRLIDVGILGGAKKLHLWIPDNQAVSAPYMTLSYHWSKAPKVLLSKASLQDLCQEIPYNQLPKSIQDAIEITRYFGIRYLWIDALCIIQDNDEDWKTESASMGDIYKFSYCTISASWAMSDEEGCFVHRGPLQAHFSGGAAATKFLGLDPTGAGKRLQPESPEEARIRGKKRLRRYSYPQIPEMVQQQSRSATMASRASISTPKEQRLLKQRKNCPGAHIETKTFDVTVRMFQKDLWASEVDSSPLSRRAWTLQERLLSPRILYFGKRQLFWECKESKACETWPNFTAKIARGEGGLPGESIGPSHELYGMAVEPLQDHWDEIVEAYTDANLSRAEDKLVAISGLARETMRKTSDSYYAGHWGKDFARGLLWYCQTPKRAASQIYRAPSWSWASVDSKVTFSIKRNSETLPLSAVETIGAVGIDGTRLSTGQIEYGFCRWRGCLITASECRRQGALYILTLREENSEIGVNVISRGEVDFFPDRLPQLPLSRAVCLPILSYLKGFVAEQVEPWQNCSVGLVLQPTGEYRDEYRRIGLFRGDYTQFDYSQGVIGDIREITIV